MRPRVGLRPATSELRRCAIARNGRVAAARAGEMDADSGIPPEPSEVTHVPREDLGAVLRLLVHDVRNPVATVLANLEVLRMIEPDDPELPEILLDLRRATQELDAGMEALSWLGRHFCGEPAFDGAPGDVVASVTKVLDDADAFSAPVGWDPPPKVLMARGGGRAGHLVRILVSTAIRYGRSATVTVETVDTMVRVTVCDPGNGLEDDDRDQMLTLTGQLALKRRSAGRYARYLGIPAVAAAVKSVGGRTEVECSDGEARFVFELPRA